MYSWRFRVLGIFSAILISGCSSYSPLQFDVLKPAEVDITPSIVSLAVISRCDLDSSLLPNDRTKGKDLVAMRDSTFSKMAVLGCSDELLQSPRFDLRNPNIRKYSEMRLADSSAKISWSIIRKTAGDPPVDGILSYEAGKVRDTLKSWLFDGWLTVYDYLVVINSTWRLYRLGDMQTADFNFVDTLSFEIEDPGEFLSSTTAMEECIRDAMYQAGKIAARRFAPSWSTVQRYVFWGPADFNKGIEFLKSGKWNEAAAVWRPFTESKNKSLAIKACCNMALACEMADKIPAASDWLEKAGTLGFDESSLKMRRNRLQLRKVELDRLNNQMK